MFQNLVILDATQSRKPSSSTGIRQLTADQIQMLRAFIQKRVMNPDDVDDILQCVFLEALRNEHKFQHASKPQTWLCGIALNLIRNHFRKCTASLIRKAGKTKCIPIWSGMTTSLIR